MVDVVTVEGRKNLRTVKRDSSGSVVFTGSVTKTFSYITGGGTTKSITAATTPLTVSPHFLKAKIIANLSAGTSGSLFFVLQTNGEKTFATCAKSTVAFTAADTKKTVTVSGTIGLTSVNRSKPSRVKVSDYGANVLTKLTCTVSTNDLTNLR